MRGTVCHHLLLGERHPSYCKLIAVAEALARGYELVAFFDSDAFFQNASVSLPRVLRAFAGNASATWDAAFASDRPNSFGPSGGVHFWRNTPATQRLLRTWWHLPGGLFHTEHDYEQHVLQWLLVHSHAWGPRIATLGLQVRSLRLDVRGWPLYEHPIVHIEHERNFFRPLLTSIALLGALGQPPKVPDVGLNRPHKPTSSSRDVFGAGESSGGSRVVDRYQTAKLRQWLIRKAAYAMQHAALGASTECSRSRIVVEDFHPTRRAAELMHQDVTDVTDGTDGVVDDFHLRGSLSILRPIQKS
jgi:hypothetical protein